MELNRRKFLQAAAIGAGGLALTRTSSPGPAFADPYLGSAGVDAETLSGLLVGAGNDYLDLKIVDYVRRIRISSGTTCWSQGTGSIGGFSIGSDVLLRLDPAGVASRMWFDLTRVIGSVQSHAGAVTTVLDRAGQLLQIRSTESTRFETFQGGLAVPPILATLAPGSLVDVIGYLGPAEEVVATIYAYEGADLPIVVNPPTVDGPVGDPSQVYTYKGHATWFRCSTGAGACGTCNTGVNNLVAWPQTASNCTGCTYNCGNCSKGCTNQQQLRCGSGVSIYAPCQQVTRQFTVVDVGPYLVDSAGRPSALCGRVCTKCNYQRANAIVDMTRETFARFFDPATVGCFPVDASVRV